MLAKTLEHQLAELIDEPEYLKIRPGPNPQLMDLTGQYELIPNPWWAKRNELLEQVEARNEPHNQVIVVGGEDFTR